MEHIIIPDSGNTLLRKEVAQAFIDIGYSVTLVHPQSLTERTHAHYLPELVSKTSSLFLSINFLGLSHEQFGIKETIKIMYDAKGKIAVWCVDNPWNLLSGIRDPKWKELPLFVTDHSFLPALERHGATKCFHLPLAGSPDFFTDKKEANFEQLSPITFVGRSCFPEKDSFYKGLSLPEGLIRTSQSMLEKGQRPDILWWTKQLGYEEEIFWPGKKQRKVSFGAEASSLQWRKICLEHASKFFHTTTELEQQKKENIDSSSSTQMLFSKRKKLQSTLDIFGDTNWKKELSHEAVTNKKIRFFPPVDYYSQLASVYASSLYSLSLTSMQLPMGLNQRHFDIWLAEGFCITDATQGLFLFPKDLTAPITFTCPRDITTTIDTIEKKGNTYRKTLQHEWKEEIQTNHLYHHRAESIIKAI